MISPISSNKSLFGASTVVVASSIVIGIFLSRMGLNAAMQTYTAAMYSLMSIGGASLAYLCVASCLKHREPPLVKVVDVVEEPVETAVEKLLREPPKKDLIFFSTLEGLGLSQPVACIVLDYAAHPIENIFIKLKRGISLPSDHPHYTSIRNALILYARICSVATDRLFDARLTRDAYLDAQKFLRGLALRVNREPADRTHICHIVTLLFHSTLDEERINHALRLPDDAYAYNDKLIDTIVKHEDPEAGIHCFSHLHKGSWEALFDNPSSFLTESRALLYLEGFLKMLNDTSESFYLYPGEMTMRGWSHFVEKVLQNKSRNTLLFKSESSLWHCFFDGVISRDQRRDGDYIGTAIALIRYQIPLPEISLSSGWILTPNSAIDLNGLKDLEKLFSILLEIRKPFSGILTDQELVTFNARLIQEGLVT